MPYLERMASAAGGKARSRCSRSARARRKRTGRVASLTAAITLLTAGVPLTAGAQGARPSAPPDQPAAPETWAIHGQSTFLLQYHPGFGTSVPMGPQSLDSGRRGNETFDATLYLGFRPWAGAEIWFNPETDQGFGLQNTLGIAGFTSGEAYKVGQRDPYYRMARGFFRQTINLGGGTETVDPDLNVLGGSHDRNRVVVTVGKYSVTDIFDANQYAHDPRMDFMNWSLIDSGAYDYAADSWGFTYGAAVEWYQDRWTLRAGLFDLSATPNSEHLTLRPGQQFEAVFEAEERHTLLGQPGKVKLLLYMNRALMVRLNTFTRIVNTTGTTPVLASLRHMATRPGVALNLEQSLTADLAAFARLSTSDGRYETFDFTDIDQSVAVGMSMKGTTWGRQDDVVAAGFVVNSASADRVAFFRAGGLGVLVGDGGGQPARYGPEEIFETYYDVAVTKWLNVTADYQLVNHPAYNVGRGPVHVFGFRLHAQY
jgi:high affinity Mn2+ porin